MRHRQNDCTGPRDSELAAGLALPLISGCISKVPIGFTSRPHQHDPKSDAAIPSTGIGSPNKHARVPAGYLAATSYRSCGIAAGNDAPLIDERAATGGAAQRTVAMRAPPMFQAGTPSAKDGPGTRTLVDDLPASLRSGML